MALSIHNNRNLGGISKDVKNFQSAINHNAYGIAGISGFWE